MAAAATIAVVYPHMNGLGGDGFWLIMPGKGDPVGIDGSGRAGSLANFDFYKGETHIPHRGPKAALTVAGTVSGWQAALDLSAELGEPPCLYRAYSAMLFAMLPMAFPSPPHKPQRRGRSATSYSICLALPPRFYRTAMCQRKAAVSPSLI